MKGFVEFSSVEHRFTIFTKNNAIYMKDENTIEKDENSLFKQK